MNRDGDSTSYKYFTRVLLPVHTSNAIRSVIQNELEMPAVITLSAMRDVSAIKQNDTGLRQMNGPSATIAIAAKAPTVEMEDKVDRLKVDLHLTKDLPQAVANRRLQNQRQRKIGPGLGRNGRDK